MRCEALSWNARDADGRRLAVVSVLYPRRDCWISLSRHQADADESGGSFNGYNPIKSNVRRRDEIVDIISWKCLFVDINLGTWTSVIGY